MFRELLDDYLTDFRINERKSLLRAEGVVGHLKGEFGHMRAVDIDTPAIKRYVAKRQAQGRMNGTINRELAAIKRTFNLAVRCTPPRVLHVPYIPMLKERNVRKGFIEQEAYVALREVLPEYLKPVLTFAYKTGWRVSEIKGLTWAQVDLENGIVRLEAGETKNDDARTVYLNKELQEVFQREEDARKERLKKQMTIIPYVFTNESGGGPVKDFRRSWVKACATAKIGKRLFHDFRRTAVRNMIRAGIPERVAMMVSGYKSRSVFDRYNIVSDTDLRLASQKTETYLRAQMGTNTGTVTEIDTQRGQAVNA